MSFPSKRYSLSPPRPGSTTASESTHNLKHRVITNLNKLSDRDTLAVAAAQLEAIARSLSQDSFSPFLSCIHNTDSSSKSPVRKQCVHLLTVLSHSHGDSLAPFLSKMIATVVRRIRDSDSTVRSACVDAVTAMSSRITKPPFSVFLKPLMEALTQEQDVNSQVGAALCLAAAIESAPEPDVESLRKSTLPRLGKLAKNEVYKVKAAVLGLIGSIVGVGGASSRAVLNWLVPSLVGFLSSEDWTVRKAAAEALAKLALVEKELVAQYTGLCLDSLQNRRFDKVKVVRETMNRALEMWKELADSSEDVSIPDKSKCTIFGPDNGEGQFAIKTSANVGFKSSQPKKTVPTSRSPPPTVSCFPTSRRASHLKSNGKKSSMAVSREQDHGEFSDRQLEIMESNPSPLNVAGEDDIKVCYVETYKPRENRNCGNSRTDIKCALFWKICDDNVPKFSGLRSESRVVQFNDDDNLHLDAMVNNINDNCENPQDFEDLSLIREQLIQIENQQSSLLDLLQRFIGSSQSELNSLETRVHALEMALDEISHELAVSSGRFPIAAEDACCRLPGAGFLSSKIWKRAEGQYSTSRLSSGSIASPKSVRNATDKDASIEMFTTNSRRFQRHSGGLFENPLADVRNNLKGHLEQYACTPPNNMVQDAKRIQVNNVTQLDGISPVTCIATRKENNRYSV